MQIFLNLINESFLYFFFFISVIITIQSLLSCRSSLTSLAEFVQMSPLLFCRGEKMVRGNNDNKVSRVVG